MPCTLDGRRGPPETINPLRFEEKSLNWGETRGEAGVSCVTLVEPLCYCRSHMRLRAKIIFIKRVP